MSTPIVTRFAPSPTGFLHIGGARTALFNWLYARHMGGKMLLRIEDTDRQRSSEAAVSAIFDGLKWLGIDHDDEPVYQFSRRERHATIAHELLAAGKAYYCYASPEELTEMREKARAEGQPPRYDGRWRDKDPSEAPSGVQPVIRIKAPVSGETIIDDQVQGHILIGNKDIDDFILLRSDGTPTYMLSVVVDDHDMKVTHVIRGDDHLTNAARQTILYDALQWKCPVWAHVPLIHGPDGAKLSKRHGALGVEAYRSMGYLPAALRNYLVRLGWAHGNDEIIALDDMIAWFDFNGIGKSPARFDFAKLENLNGHYIRMTSNEVLLDTLISTLPYFDQFDDIKNKLDDIYIQRLKIALPSLKERAKSLVELLDSARFLFDERPLTLQEKAYQQLDQGGREILVSLLPKLENVHDWQVDIIEETMKSFAIEENLKLGKVAQPVRAALTGRMTSPGIFDVLMSLGRDETLARIRDQINSSSD